MCENITISCVVKNLDIDGSKFDFGDFKFIKIRQGPKAAEWRKKMSCKEVPRHILTMNFMNYEPNDDDITGYAARFCDNVST